MRYLRTSLLILSLVISSALFAVQFTNAQTSGAAVVTVNAPTTNGSSVAITGNTTSGMRWCGGSACTGGHGGPICNCCSIPPPECQGGLHQSCLVTGISYAITGPVSRNGSATIGTTSLSPSGCTTQCSTIEVSKCQEARNFSVNQSNLPAGTYTVVVTSTDCAGQNTSQPRTFTIAPALTCALHSSTPSPQFTGDSVRFDAAGGTGTYNWATPGYADRAGVQNATLYVSYATIGTKTVTVTSGNESKQCTVQIVESPEEPDVFCLPETVDVQVNTNITFTAEEGNGTYSWVAQNGNPASRTPSTNPSFITKFTSTGQKTVTVTSGSNDGSCIINVIPTPPITTQCSPNQQSVNINQAASLTGTFTSGSGTLTWNSGGGTPPSETEAAPSSFAPSYNTSGTKNITLSSAGQGTSTCTVIVNPQPGVPLSCTPSPNPVAPNTNVTFTAGGGTLSGYQWRNTPTGSVVGTASTYTRQYSTSGTQTMYLRDSAGTNAECSVSVYNGSTLFADVKANGSDGPVTITSGQTAGLTWNSNGASCSARWSSPTADPQWTGATTRSGSKTTSALTSTRVYYIQCINSSGGAAQDGVVINVTTPLTGTVVVQSNVASTWTLTGPPGGGGAQATPSTSRTYSSQPTGSYTLVANNVAGYGTPTIVPVGSQTLGGNGTLVFNINYPAATVDLDANGSDAPAAIAEGTGASLSWTTANVTAGTCVASQGWSGSKANSGAETSTPLSDLTTFRLTCTPTGGGSVFDTVSVDVRDPYCVDNVDNDSDGYVDEADPGCAGGPTDDDESNSFVQCNDSQDNDGDGLIDWPDDPACPNALGNSEIEDVIGQCNDGLDNDGDGLLDMDDDGCVSPTDPRETPEPDIREI